MFVFARPVGFSSFGHVIFCGFFVRKGTASFEGGVGCEANDVSECY